MPIKGLTDRPNLMPRKGKIYLGKMVPSSSGKERPTATPYFVVPDEVAEVFGPEPTQLRVMLPTNDPAIIAPTWYKAYLQSTLACRGDGELATRLIYNDQAVKIGDGLYQGPLAKGRALPANQKRSASRYQIRCLGEECPDYISKDCTILMQFQFLLPDVPGYGCWQIDTGSFNSVRNIYNSLAYLEMFGDPRGVMLDLSLRPQPAIRPDGHSNTIYCLHLEYNGTLAHMLEAVKTTGFALAEGVDLKPDDSRPDLIVPRGGHEPEPEPPVQQRTYDTRRPAEIERDFWDRMEERNWTREMLEGVLGKTWKEWTSVYPRAQDGCDLAWQMMEEAYDEPEPPPPGETVVDEINIESDFVQLMEEAETAEDMTWLRRKVYDEMEPGPLKTNFIEMIQAGADAEGFVWVTDELRYVTPEPQQPDDPALDWVTNDEAAEAMAEGVPADQRTPNERRDTNGQLL